VTTAADGGRARAILDTDIGGDIDDIWAVAMALKCPELNVKLMVSDSFDTVHKAQLLARLAQVADRTDIPIGVGTPLTIGVSTHNPQSAWIEGYALSQHPGPVHEDGVQAIIDAVMESEQVTTLTAIGPAPNTAEALRREPGIAPRVRYDTAAVHLAYSRQFLETRRLSIAVDDEGYTRRRRRGNGDGGRHGMDGPGRLPRVPGRPAGGPGVRQVKEPARAVRPRATSRVTFIEPTSQNRIAAQEGSCMHSGPIINIHTHLRLADDLPARVAIWRKWNMEKVVCLSVHDRWRAVGYAVNRDYPAPMAQYPDLIVGFAAVDLQAGSIDHPDALDRFRDQGYAGLKFEDNTYPYNHEAYWPLYERAEQLELPILFHTGFLAMVRTDDVNCDARDGIDAENMRPYLLDKVARSFPDLKIIAAHLGNPHFQEALSMIAQHGNLYADISGGSGAKPHIRKVLAALLPPAGLGTDMSDPEENLALGWFEKLCFATDNPSPDIWVPASEQIMDRLEIPAALRRRFYYDNAAAILGIGG